MGFLRKLFGGGDDKPKEYVDESGLYFYFQCDKCGARVKVRADKQHDLLREGGGYSWHKTIVDSKCFRRMETVVQLDINYNVTNYTLEGGQFLTEAEYEAAEAAAGSAASSVDETAVEEAEDDAGEPTEDE